MRLAPALALAALRCGRSAAVYTLGGGPYGETGNILESYLGAEQLASAAGAELWLEPGGWLWAGLERAGLAPAQLPAVLAGCTRWRTPAAREQRRVARDLEAKEAFFQLFEARAGPRILQEQYRGLFATPGAEQPGVAAVARAALVSLGVEGDYTALHLRSLAGTCSARMKAQFPGFKDPCRWAAAEVAAAVAALGRLAVPLVVLDDHEGEEAAVAALRAHPQLGWVVQRLPPAARTAADLDDHGRDRAEARDLWVGRHAGAFLGTPASTFAVTIARARVARGANASTNVLFRPDEAGVGAECEDCLWRGPTGDPYFSAQDREPPTHQDREPPTSLRSQDQDREPAAVEVQWNGEVQWSGAGPWRVQLNLREE